MCSKQAALISKLYGGMQCSGCGARFPPEHTVRYSQHLDWHFRQNRRERDSARRAHSRDWHYDLADWLQYEELEDLEERKKSWFETTGLLSTAAAAPAPAPPSVAAGPPARAACALCGDTFLQFYNEDREEWHLRNSVSHEGQNYHPLCLEDYKASLMKEEPPKEEVSEVEKPEEEAIEIKDVDDTLDQSDNESVVEVIEPEKPIEIEEVEEVEESVVGEPPMDLEAEAEDDDDVVFKAEPVDQLVVDDYDTDDETAAAHDEPIITAEEELVRAAPDTSRPTVLSSIDGNVQLEAPAQASVLPGIRINISKVLAPVEPTPAPIPHLDSLEDVSADEEPPPPGEEIELEYKRKPTLEGVVFSRQLPKQKGTELSGLCSIM
ncbi:hypothetical protein MSG28_009410 [Choristoneura fumiferana]|uniref:Uncharacterized protein n=1 Tax=Choristoneura fumiferana TaxID=7141 RepID=A0ACC0KX90_CHOFU|nr:hypothetical protein MSG28_009410 [Choristoneura fumiferana]